MDRNWRSRVYSPLRDLPYSNCRCTNQHRFPHSSDQSCHSGSWRDRPRSRSNCRRLDRNRDYEREDRNTSDCDSSRENRKRPRSRFRDHFREQRFDHSGERFEGRETKYGRYRNGVNIRDLNLNSYRLNNKDLICSRCVDFAHSWNCCRFDQTGLF